MTDAPSITGDAALDSQTILEKITHGEALSEDEQNFVSHVVAGAEPTQPRSRLSHQHQYEQFRHRLAQVVNDDSVSIQKKAQYCGVASTSVKRWAKSGHISKDNLARLCEVTGYDLDWVVHGGDTNDAEMTVEQALQSQSPVIRTPHGKVEIGSALRDTKRKLGWDDDEQFLAAAFQHHVFRHRLAQVIKTLDMTNKEIGLRLNVTEGAVRNWKERGTISRYNLERLCQLSGFRYAWVALGQGPETANAIDASDAPDEDGAYTIKTYREDIHSLLLSIATGVEAGSITDRDLNVLKQQVSALRSTPLEQSGR